MTEAELEFDTASDATPSDAAAHDLHAPRPHSPDQNMQQAEQQPPGGPSGTPARQTPGDPPDLVETIGAAAPTATDAARRPRAEDDIDAPTQPPPSDMAPRSVHPDAHDDEIVVPRAQQRYSSSRRRRRRSGKPELVNRALVDRVLRYGVLAAILIAPVAVGGVHFLPGLALGALGVALGALAVAAHWRRGGVRPGLIGAALAVWLAATVLQLVPLPFGLVEVLSPQAASHYQRAYAVLGETPDMVALSLSPSRTAMALWHVLGFMGLFTAGFLHFRERERFAWLVPRLAVAGMIFVAISVLQTTMFDGSVLGFYEPAQAIVSTPLETTLVNPNHAAAFFAALALVALGYGLATRDIGQRYTFIFFYLVLSVAMFLTLSRGAILAWALCHPVFFFLLKNQAFKSRIKAGAVGVAVCAAVTAAVFVVHGRMGDTFGSMADSVHNVGQEATRPVDEPGLSAAGETGATSDATAAVDEQLLSRQQSTAYYDDETRRPFEKVFIYRDLAPIVSSYPLIGIGRDAFGEVYPPHASHGFQRTFRHVENEYLEFVVEYGPITAALFFGLLGLGLVLLVSRTDWREAERPLVAGVLTAIIFIAIHNIFDFNLRFPGVGFALALMLGMAAGRGSRYADVERQRKARKREQADGDHAASHPGLLSVARRGVGYAFVGTFVIGVVAGGLGIAQARQGGTADDIEAVRDEVESMNEELKRGDDARAQLVEMARPALLARPVDGYLRMLVAIGMLRTGEGGVDAALPWLELARELNPTDARVHLLLGRVHAARGELDQAAGMFATAANLDHQPSVAVARSVAQLMTETDGLLASLSADPSDWTALGTELIRVRRFDDAIVLAEHLEATFPTRPEGLDLLVQVYLALGIAEAATGPADELIRRFADDPNVFLRRSQVALALDDVQHASHVLRDGIEAHPKDIDLLFTRLELLLYKARATFNDELEWEAELTDTLEQLRPLALSRKPKRPRYHHLRGEMLRLTDEPRQALRAFDEASRLNPRWYAPMIGALNVALELGDVDRARNAWEALSAAGAPSKFLLEQRRRIDVRESEVQQQQLTSPFLMGGSDGDVARRKLGLDREIELGDPLSPNAGVLAEPDAKQAPANAQGKSQRQKKNEAPEKKSAPESEQPEPEATPETE